MVVLSKVISVEEERGIYFLYIIVSWEVLSCLSMVVHEILVGRDGRKMREFINSLVA